MLDAETLKTLGISTIGQRLAILKAVYLLKVANNIPIDSDSYIPPCSFLNIPFSSFLDCRLAEAQDRSENVTVEKLHVMVKDQGTSLQNLSIALSLMLPYLAERLRALEEENKNLNATLQSFLDDYNNLRQSFVSRSSVRYYKLTMAGRHG